MYVIFNINIKKVVGTLKIWKLIMQISKLSQVISYVIRITILRLLFWAEVDLNENFDADTDMVFKDPALIASF